MLRAITSSLRSSALPAARSDAVVPAVAAAVLVAASFWARGGVGVAGPGEEASETGADGGLAVR